MLEPQRILFLPIPKSGCTSVMWTLAEVAGLDRERFVGSRAAEISRAMAVHDMDLWRPEHRWAEHGAAEQQAMQEDPSWLRLSVVRDPAPRLWSAWQSKILLAEPRFVQRFGEEPWFPRELGSLPAVVDSFRAFVAALDVPADEAPHDAHWGPQADLMAGFDLNYIGRSEDPAATLDRIAEHLAERTGEPSGIHRDVPRENANPIPFHPSVYDDASAAVLHRVYAQDYAAFGYAQLAPESAAEGQQAWQDLAVGRLRLVGELVERHRRIGELIDLLAHDGRELSRLRRDRDRLQGELDAVLGSRAWRLTAPLRRLASARRRT